MSDEIGHWTYHNTTPQALALRSVRLDNLWAIRLAYVWKTKHIQSTLLIN